MQLLMADHLFQSTIPVKPSSQLGNEELIRTLHSTYHQLMSRHQF